MVFSVQKWISKHSLVDFVANKKLNRIKKRIHETKQKFILGFE